MKNFFKVVLGLFIAVNINNNVLNASPMNLSLPNSLSVINNKNNNKVVTNKDLVDLTVSLTNNLVSLYITGYNVENLVDSYLQNNKEDDIIAQAMRYAVYGSFSVKKYNVTQFLYEFSLENDKKNLIDLLKEYNINIDYNKNNTIYDITNEVFSKHFKEFLNNNDIEKSLGMLGLLESRTYDAAEQSKEDLDRAKEISQDNKAKAQFNEINKKLKNYLLKNSLFTEQMNYIIKNIKIYEESLKDLESIKFKDYKEGNDIKYKLINITNNVINYLKNGISHLKEIGINTEKL